MDDLFDNWELKLGIASIVIGVVSVWFLFRAPKVPTPPKPKDTNKPKQVQPPKDKPVVGGAGGTHESGQSIASLVKAQAKRKGATVPSHPLFVRNFKSSGHGDITCFAVSPDGRVRDSIACSCII